MPASTLSHTMQINPDGEKFRVWVKRSPINEDVYYVTVIFVPVGQKEIVLVDMQKSGLQDEAFNDGYNIAYKFIRSKEYQKFKKYV